MKEFVFAALPTVMCGIAVAIICVCFASRKHEGGIRNNRHIAVGVALGLMLGAAVNQSGIFANHFVGIILCVLWGVAMSALYEKSEDYYEK